MEVFNIGNRYEMWISGGFLWMAAQLHAEKLLELSRMTDVSTEWRVLPSCVPLLCILVSSRFTFFYISPSLASFLSSRVGRKAC